MRICILLIVFGLGTSASSKDASVVANEVAQAIYTGSPITDIEGAPELTALELADLKGLAGCQPTNEAHAKALIPIFDWNCADRPKASRTVAFYLSEGRVVDLLVQPVAKNFSPTQTAATASELPSRNKIMKLFLRAVRKGDDPTLSGIIPITEIQLHRLTIAKGSRVQKMSGGNRYSQVHVWTNAVSRMGSMLITDLRFDDEGRPVGLVISHAARARKNR